MHRNIKLALLDRDGVLNEDRSDFVKTPDELVMIPGACKAVTMLNQAGIKVAMVTNQSCVGRGIITAAQLWEIHEKMQAELAKFQACLDKIFVCPDHPDNATERRKPGPGMLREAMGVFQVTPEETVMIGDSLRDIQAAAAAGCERILVGTGRGKETFAQGIPQDLQPITRETNLLTAINNLLGVSDIDQVGLGT